MWESYILGKMKFVRRKYSVSYECLRGSLCSEGCQNNWFCMIIIIIQIIKSLILLLRFVRFLSKRLHKCNLMRSDPSGVPYSLPYVYTHHCPQRRRKNVTLLEGRDFHSWLLTFPYCLFGSSNWVWGYMPFWLRFGLTMLTYLKNLSLWIDVDKRNLRWYCPLKLHGVWAINHHLGSQK